MKDVIIIGAGAAGIYLGNLLNKICNVLILEATNSFGGRIVSKTINGKEINLGAEYIHCNNLDNDPFGHLIVSLLAKNKNNLVPVKGKSWLSCLNCDWYDGKTFLSENEKLITLKKLVKNKDLKSKNETFWEQFILDRLYFYISPNLIRDNQLYQSDPELILKSSQLMETNLLENDADWYLSSSFQNILNKLIEKSNLCINYNSIVTGISFQNNVYEIKTIVNQKEIIYTSKYVILTVPLGCLKQNHLSFEPELPKEIKESISKIGFGHHNKIIVSLPNEINNNNENKYFVVKDSFIHWSNYHKNILIGHILGSKNVSKIEIENQGKKDLNSLNIIFNELEIIDWRENKFAGNGSYSFLIDLKDKNLVENFQKPIKMHPNLYFCGECYGLDGFQTVRGAFNSARVVYKKLEKLFVKGNCSQNCFHLKNLPIDFPFLDQCDGCEQTLEIWECLECNYKGCGRYKNKCSENHFLETNHPLVLSYPDRNIWCYICDCYVKY